MEGEKIKVFLVDDEAIILQGLEKTAGFILGPGCALGGDTPKENIMAMLNCVR